MTLMDIAPLSTRAGAFIEYLDEWLEDLLPAAAGKPDTGGGRAAAYRRVLRGCYQRLLL